jgi:PAS domain S-box-containing protein
MYLIVGFSVGSLRPFGIMASLITPALVAPPICIILLRASLALDLTRKSLLRVREDLEARVEERTEALRNANERLTREIQEKASAEEELWRHRALLEELVIERTTELETKNSQLKSEILERRKSEEKLRESEERYRIAVQASPDGVFIHVHGSIQFANRSFANLVGAKEPEDLYGLTPLSLVHPDSLELVQEKITNFAQGKEQNPLIEQKLLRMDGSTVEVEAHGVPVSFGGTDAIMVVMRDIGERKRAAANLRNLSRAIEASRATVVITDMDGAIEYANPAFTWITGYTLEEALGRNPRVLKSGVHPPEFYETMWNTILAGNVWEGEMCNKRKNGTLYWELASISPVRSSTGEISHFVAVKEDITEKRRLS